MTAETGTLVRIAASGRIQPPRQAQCRTLTTFAKRLAWLEPMDENDRGGDRDLGSRLRQHRRAAGLTQHQLAGRAGVSVGSLRDLEQGRVRRPRPAALAALATALDLDQAQAGELVRAMTAERLRVRVLGPLTVWRDGAVIPLGGPARRAVLALLALAPGSLVRRDAIIDALWPERPPADAVNLIQAHVSRLRRSLDPDRDGVLVSAGASYQLRVRLAQLDLLAFRQLAVAARAARGDGDQETACDLYQRALGLWQGEPLADVDLLRGDAAVAELARQHTEAVLEYAQAAAAIGRHDQVLPRLRQLAGREPLNERAHAQLMIALAGCGQQAEALAIYHELRRRLDEELAMRPGPDLAQAHQQVLCQAVPVARPAAAEITSDPGTRAGRAAAMSPVPRQLPGPPPSFTGRAAALSALNELVDTAAGTVVISAIGGTAGIGKTALAVRWAHQIAAKFPDGQLYVNLRGFGPSGTPAEPGEVIRGFLDALGVTPERIPASLDAQVGLYRSLVHGKRLLFVLDNARDADQARPLLPGSPGCLALVTSRVRLAGLAVSEGARLLSLDVLADDEARELLATRLGRQRVAAEPAATDTLIGLCARLPLALAIAAARAADRPGFPLTALAAELRDAASRLDVLDTGDAASSVRAALSWSFQDLSEPAARMFRLVGLHRGPDITAQAGASLAGIPLPAARQALGELAAAHVIAEHAPGRFAFHDLLRDYAAEQAEAAESEEARYAAIHRLLDHYLHTAHAAAVLLNPLRDRITLPPPRPGVTPEKLAGYHEALAWFEGEHEVLLASVSLATELRFDAHAWQLPWTVADYLDRRGHWHDWAAIQRTARAAATRLGDIAGQALTNRLTSAAYHRLADFDREGSHLRDALRLYRQLGDRVGEARVHQALSVNCEAKTRFADALSHSEQALALFQSAGHRAGQAYALNCVGWCHILLGHPERARAICRQALALHRELGERIGEAHTWDSLGYAGHQLGQLTEAGACYQRALALFRELGERYHEADTLANLGDTYQAGGRPLEAQRAWRRALEILDDLRHPDAGRVRAKLGHQETVPRR